MQAVDGLERDEAEKRYAAKQPWSTTCSGTIRECHVNIYVKRHCTCIEDLCFTVRRDWFLYGLTDIIAIRVCYHAVGSHMFLAWHTSACMLSQSRTEVTDPWMLTFVDTQPLTHDQLHESVNVTECTLMSCVFVHAYCLGFCSWSFMNRSVLWDIRISMTVYVLREYRLLRRILQCLAQHFENVQYAKLKTSCPLTKKLTIFKQTTNFENC